jgi:hypothetical protein
MPKAFVFRSQAVEAAQREHKNFRTSQDEHKMWKFHYEPGESPAEGWQHFDFVNHVETGWDRSGDTPRKVGVLVVTCRLDEITNEDLAAIKKQGHIIEPLTPSLFDKGGTDTPKANARKGTSGAFERARSDVESPVKLVWRLADEMAGAERKDVIAACVAAGVNKATASTQYYRWQKSKT